MPPEDPASTPRTAVLLFAQGYQCEEKSYGLGPAADRVAHDAMVRHVARTAARVCASSEFADYLVASDGILPEMEEARTRFEQSGESFAERFRNALRSSFELGYDRVLVVGGDHPRVDASDLERALGAAPDEVVVGPSDDGGFYLLSLTVDQLPVLEGLEWHSSHLFGQLAARVYERGDDLRTLPPRSDVDTPADARAQLPRIALLVRQYIGLALEQLLGDAPSSRMEPPRTSLSSGTANPVRGPPGA